MASNLHIDQHLLAEALKIGEHKSKRETVNEALREYVLRRKQMDIIGSFGTIDYYEDYDPKAQRRRNVGMRRDRGAR